MLSITGFRADGMSIMSTQACPLENDGPAFTWAAASGLPGDGQVACRIVIHHGERLLWDSGRLQTAEQSMTCPSIGLPPGEICRVGLLVENTAGEVAEAEGKVYLAATQWHARWICDAADTDGSVAYFRREFRVKKPLASACLYAAAAGYHRLSLDGAPLSEARLDPAHTDYARTCQYVVLPDLRISRDTHCLGVMLAQGWRRNFAVSKERVGRQVTFAGQPAFSAMLRLTYADGETEWICTDESWECGHGAYVYADIFNGVQYDAQKHSPAWDKPGHRGFDPAKISDFTPERMTPMLIPPVTAHERLRPVAVWRLDEDTEIVDFGRNIAGVVRLRLPKMKAGHRVEMRHAELTDEVGDLYLAPLKEARAEDVYVASGDVHDLTVFEPAFTYHGFRYVRVRGLGHTLREEDIEAVTLRTGLDTLSSFRCGSPVATAIHQAVIHTEQANMHAILTDCPNRSERQGWLNDATVRFEEMPYNFDVQRMFTKVVRDITDTQGEGGEITCTAPFVYGRRPADPVCSSYLIAAWQVWMHYGDIGPIAEGYPHFCAWEAFLLSRSEEWIVDYSYYGDWAAPAYASVVDGGVCARSAVTPGVFMSTGYSYFNCRMLADFADLLGMKEDAVRHLQNAESIRAAMMSKWYDKENARFATGSQACQAFALWLDLLPEADAQRAAAALRDDLLQNGDRFTTGNLCTRYLFDVLTRYGYVNDAWRLFTSEKYPSLGYMLQNEATTIWERFELKKDPAMNSHSHPMFGAVDSWLWSWVAGIRPARPGYDAIEIRPHMPTELLSLQAVEQTVKGEVMVRMLRRYGATHLMVSIPFGTNARVHFGGQVHEVASGYHTFSEPDVEA